MDSPISILNTICSANDVTPQFTMISREGQVHSPTFTYRCEVATFVAEASGQSKKKAKHEAAKRMLIELLKSDGLEIENRLELLKKFKTDIDRETCEAKSKKSDTSQTTDPEATSEDAISLNKDSVQEEDDVDNPVGRLQEICMKKHWNPPAYDFVKEVGLAHDRQFEFACTIKQMNITEYGRGRSKKMAKRESAQSMMHRLKTENLDRVDEILDRIPKKPGMPAEEGFNFARELVTVRDDLGETLKLKHELMQAIRKNTQRLSDLVTILAKPVIEIIEKSKNDEELFKIYPLTDKIITALNCRLSIQIFPMKNNQFEFDCYVDLASLDEKFTDLVIVTGWASDEQLELAKKRAICNAIVMFLSLFEKPLSKTSVPHTIVSTVDTCPERSVNRVKFPELRFGFDDD